MKAKTTEPTGTATTSQRDCRSRRSKLMRTLACHESRKLGLVMVSSRGRRPAPPRIGSLALRAAGDALHEPFSSFFSIDAIVAFVFAETLGPNGASFVKPSLIVP